MMNTKQLLSLAAFGATGMLCSAEEYGAFHVTPLHDNVRMVHGQQLSPQDAVADIRLSGWRGERVTAQFAACWETSEDYSTVITELVGECDLRSEDGSNTIFAGVLGVSPVEAHGKAVADAIFVPEIGIWANETQLFLLQVDIPADAAPGRYRGELVVSSPGVKEARIPVELVVEGGVLPKPSEWQFHLDLWQHPQSIARVHDVEPWSEAHFAAMRPYMQMLAEAGQKAITCTLLDEAWNGQTHDAFPSNIEWIKGKDGTWRYDFSAFDAWVEFMMNEIGIREQISCYTMVPWHMKVRYLDEATGTYKHIKLDVNKPVWEETWGPFLTAFRAHLQQKGWLHKTCIALDERPDHMARAAKAMVDKYAPELRIVSAVDKPSAFTREVYNLSPIITHADTVLGDLLAERKAQGKKTTIYVCLHPQKPNTFTFSPPLEAEWLGLFVAANELDGFLRWAYNSWNAQPLECTDFGKWPSGDCFLVYPSLDRYCLSSVRFERLRDGIEDAEKIRILRERAASLGTPEAKAAIDKLNHELRALFTVARSKGNSHGADVLRARELISGTTEILFRP
ncbi:MAG: DUF4091 domain-containing protein [Akkermansia sp.]|nr:DUF4091 domain-containing protein [Akkermansia sp.]